MWPCSDVFDREGGLQRSERVCIVGVLFGVVNRILLLKRRGVIRLVVILQNVRDEVWIVLTIGHELILRPMSRRPG